MRSKTSLLRASALPLGSVRSGTGSTYMRTATGVRCGVRRIAEAEDEAFGMSLCSWPDQSLRARQRITTGQGPVVLARSIPVLAFGCLEHSRHLLTLALCVVQRAVLHDLLTL